MRMFFVFLLLVHYSSIVIELQIRLSRSNFSVLEKLIKTPDIAFRKHGAAQRQISGFCQC